MASGSPIEEIFTLEYHPVDDVPHRVRFCVTPGSNDIRRITERQTNGDWSTVEVEVIDYFEYSDE